MSRSKHTVQDVIRASTELERIFSPTNAKVCSKCESIYDSGLPRKYHKNMVNRGCCGGCALSQGYLRRDLYFKGKYDSPRRNEAAIIRKLKSLYWWDNAYGFFNPIDCRCNLPRPLRSRTCLGFFCSKAAYLAQEPIAETINSHVRTIADFKDQNPNWIDQIMEAIHATT